jgi:hypothetical protein
MGRPTQVLKGADLREDMACIPESVFSRDCRWSVGTILVPHHLGELTGADRLPPPDVECPAHRSRIFKSQYVRIDYILDIDVVSDRGPIFVEGWRQALEIV